MKRKLYKKYGKINFFCVHFSSTWLSLGGYEGPVILRNSSNILFLIVRDKYSQKFRNRPIREN